MKGERYDVACFLFQQAAEKALKAFLYSRGLKIVFGHSVRELCQQCSKYNTAFGKLGLEVNGLDGYYIPTRYPSGLPDSIPAEVYTLRDAQNTRRMCKLILELVKSKI